jgi:hypothetical protein
VVSHPYKGQNILIAESAEAAQRSAKVFLGVRPFEFDVLFLGSLVRSLLCRLLYSALLRVSFARLRVQGLSTARIRTFNPLISRRTLFS